MAACSFAEYEAHVPEWGWDGLAYIGTCPCCREPGLVVKRYEREEFGVSCANGCQPWEIDDALYKLVQRRQPTNGATPPPQGPVSASGRKPESTYRRPGEGFTAAELMAMELPEPKWAVPGLICTGCTLLCGAQKLGKSWLCYHLGIAIASGADVLGQIEVIQGDVLYLALEDNKRRLKQRLEKLLCGDPAPERLRLHTEWPAMGQGGLEGIRTWLEAHQEARLVIVDTFKKIRPPRAKNGSWYDEDYDQVDALKTLADEFDVAIVPVLHTNQGQHADVFDRASGTMGLTGAADATIILDRKRGDRIGFLHLTGRDVEEKADEDALGIELCSITGRWSLVGTAGELKRSDERKEILALLTHTGIRMKPQEIADTLDKQGPAVRKLLQKMRNEGQVTWEKGGYGPSF